MPRLVSTFFTGLKGARSAPESGRHLTLTQRRAESADPGAAQLMLAAAQGYPREP